MGTYDTKSGHPISPTYDERPECCLCGNDDRKGSVRLSDGREVDCPECLRQMYIDKLADQGEYISYLEDRLNIAPD